MKTIRSARPLALAALTLSLGAAATAAFAAAPPAAVPPPAAPPAPRPAGPVPALANAGAGDRSAVAPVPHRRGPAAVFPVGTRAVDYGTAINRFGAPRAGHMHGGQDVFAPAGTPLVAIRAGVIVEAGTDGARGNHVSVYSRAAGATFAYFHLQAPTARRVGERVPAGARLGAVGCTGNCQGDHLHLEMHRGRGAGGAGLDPLPLLRRLEPAARRG
ncbi:MAG: M23 family metallopeptidase [Solirubrobacteraceae bacterium]